MNPGISRKTSYSHDYYCYIENFEAGLDLVLESSEDYITAELDKQKRRLRDMSQLMEQQHTLIRLIVQVRFKVSKTKDQFLIMLSGA